MQSLFPGSPEKNDALRNRHIVLLFITIIPSAAGSVTNMINTCVSAEIQFSFALQLH